MENTLLLEPNCENKMVILHIISAYGFGMVKGSIVVYATLMNNKFETPIIPVNNNELEIASEIVWYFESATLKKFKTFNRSIQVECFNIPTNESSLPERLGYLLLKVKEAQTINPKSNVQIENKTYKLIGSKKCHFDLTLSLRIEDYNVKTIDITKNDLTLINNNINDNINNFKKEEENTNVDEFIEIDLPKNNTNILKHTENLSNNQPQHFFDFDVYQKLIDELEDWKDKQMTLFNEKMEMKEKQLFNDFTNEWVDERKRINEELAYEMLKCKELSENTNIIADLLKDKEDQITAKELELVYQKDNLENKYNDLIQNVQSSNAQTVDELSNKLSELKKKLHSAEKYNILLNTENEQLKNDINSSLKIQQLENSILKLKSKCEKANQSCILSKERWLLSVNRINQMYNKLYKIK